MKNVLDKLHNDHKNFSQLLNFLEQELNQLKQCEHAELELILIAIRYMKEYPDHIHHPLENVVFHYFLDHYQEEHQAIADLLDEHESMPLLTETLLKMVQYALMDEPIKREKLCNYLEEYITTQKQHMDIEEARVYPVLKSTMREEDWNQIDSELAEVNDPLFGRLIKESYKPLFNYISTSN